MTRVLLSDLRPLLKRAAAFFADEPAAVSTVAIFEHASDRSYVAIVRDSLLGAVPVGTFSSEAAALAALEGVEPE